MQASTFIKIMQIGKGIRNQPLAQSTVNTEFSPSCWWHFPLRSWKPPRTKILIHHWFTASVLDYLMVTLLLSSWSFLCIPSWLLSFSPTVSLNKDPGSILSATSLYSTKGLLLGPLEAISSPRLRNPSSLSLSLQGTWNRLVALCQTHSSLLMSFLH